MYGNGGGGRWDDDGLELMGERGGCVETRRRAGAEGSVTDGIIGICVGGDGIGLYP